MNKGIIYIMTFAVLSGCDLTSSNQFTEVLLFDDFSSIQRGPYSVEVGAHTEYHYIHEAAPRSQWAVSTFTWDLEFQRAWRVQQEGNDRQMIQTLKNVPGKHTHPMIVAGEPDWKDYSVSLQFTPELKDLQSGMVFRYRNDRCYYFAGVKGDSLILKMVKHATAFHKPYEKLLGSTYLKWDKGELLTMQIELQDLHISCSINDAKIKAEDTTYTVGKIGLMADVPTKYHQVEVKTSPDEIKGLKKSREEYARELDEIRASVPEMKTWKKIFSS